MDTSALHTVTETFASYLSEVTPGDLAAPTPCEGWDVDDLYRHMLEENVHFGLAVTGTHGTPADLALVVGASAFDAAAGSHGGGLDGRYRRTADDMTRAFAAVSDATQTRRVPGVPGARTIHDLYEMQLCDTVIHTWDLARAIGFEHDVEHDLEPEIAQRVLRILELVPDSARGAGKAFGVVQGSAGEGGSALERIVRLSGRVP